ncbi:hypothetical protein EH30_12495, partial [Erythrobacter sp. JL475]
MRRSLLPVALLLSSTSAFAQSGPWTVTETRGDVLIRTPNGERVAKRGETLTAGHQVVTGSGGNATIVRGQEFVTVRPNSRITIVPRERERGVIQIIQDFGSALFNVGKQQNPHFGVDTPYLAAVVKGTTFSITVSEEGASMQVTEGAVEASTVDGGARDLVRPGEVAMIAAGDRFRLNIEGDVPRQIDSPQRAVTTPAPAAPAAAAATSSGNSVAAPQATSQQVTPAANGNAGGNGQSATAPGAPVAAARRAAITSPVASSNSNLAELTGGLVSGEVEASIEVAAVQSSSSSGTEEAIADTSVTAASASADTRRNEAAGSNGNAGGNSGSSGSSADNGNSGNSNTGGNGNGNGNSGGADDGSDEAPGN